MIAGAFKRFESHWQPLLFLTSSHRKGCCLHVEGFNGTETYPQYAHLASDVELVAVAGIFE